MQLCWKCGTPSNAFKMFRGTKFLWKVWASLKSFKTHAKWFLQLCGKCGTPSNAFKMLRRTEFVWKVWASLICFQKPCKMIFAIMLKAGLLKMLTITEFVWKVWAGPLYNAFKTQTNYFHTIMWKVWEKMLFRCWKLSLWFCVNLLYKVRAWDARRCLYSNFNIWFLCGKCRLPWNIFKPRHIIFAIMWKVWDSLKCF